MPHQNRVLPTGEIVAIPERGMFMGNRGILHDATGRLGTSRWKHHNWICCALSFKGRKRQVMRPGRYYTELFFFDEAVALAAGHRPCAECRRTDYERYRDAWETAFGTRPAAPEIDRALHRDRVRRNRSQVRHEAQAGELPDGAYVLEATGPALVLGGRLLPFSPTGYGTARVVTPRARLTVLTPRTTLSVLLAGYRAELHPTASV